MTADIVAVSPDDVLDEALDLMVEHGLSFVPVVDRRGRCVGALSITRLLELARSFDGTHADLGHCLELPPSLFIDELSQPGFGDKKVQEVMCAPAVVVSPDATLIQAAQAMVDHRVHRLIVSDRRHQLLGLISTMDLLQAFARAGERCRGDAPQPPQGGPDGSNEAVK